jgi:hypothetical protein
MMCGVTCTKAQLAVEKSKETIKDTITSVLYGDNTVSPSSKQTAQHYV